MPIREWDDSEDDVYSFEKELEANEPYGQRTSELAVVNTGLEPGINTLVIISPVLESTPLDCLCGDRQGQAII